MAFLIQCFAFALAASAALAQSDVVIQADRAAAESATSTSDGTLIIGSLKKGEIYRARKGEAKAQVWISAGTSGLQHVLGVLADEKSNTLWVCSTNFAKEGGVPTALKTFDLQSGTPKGSWDFPGGHGLCNDIAIASNGDAYVTDTTGGRVLRLKKSASALEEWLNNDLLASADGIAFADDTTIYVNTVSTGHLIRIPINADGSAGPIHDMQLSKPLTHPDGMRSFKKNEFLLIEGAGRLDRVKVDGDTATVEVLKDGFDHPTAVTQTGDTAWVLEGQMGPANDMSHEPPPAKLRPVALR